MWGGALHQTQSPHSPLTALVGVSSSLRPPSVLLSSWPGAGLPAACVMLVPPIGEGLAEGGREAHGMEEEGQQHHMQVGMCESKMDNARFCSVLPCIYYDAFRVLCHSPTDSLSVPLPTLYRSVLFSPSAEGPGEPCSRLRVPAGRAVGHKQTAAVDGSCMCLHFALEPTRCWGAQGTRTHTK